MSGWSERWSEISFTSEAVARERKHEAVARKHEAVARERELEAVARELEADARKREHEAVARKHEAVARKRELEAVARELEADARERKHEVVARKHEAVARERELEAVARKLEADARERKHEAVARERELKAVARELKADARARKHEAVARKHEAVARERELKAVARELEADAREREHEAVARERELEADAREREHEAVVRELEAVARELEADARERELESAIKGKAPRPPRPEKTPQARRQSVTSFITSIFKYKKQMEMKTLDGTNEGKRAGSDSSEPRPTTLGLARIFPYEELMEATDGFKQQVGEGGFSSVYLGKLRDKREVAVKVLYEGIKKRFEQFINEVTILSRLRHQNLVSLYGCTDPETHKLLIVYEFVPNGTLASHLHGERPPLSCALRIQIAIEIAMALAYLHSQVPSLIHRDVKTSNILLDNDFHPKVADFGMCRLVPWDTTYVSTQPQGTMGYRDPEYDLNFKLTDKSDVYSFGVVLLELISGKQAVDVYQDESEIYLINMALNKILNKNLWQLVDSRLGYDSESEIGRMINSAAELACMCLQPEANKRPPMAEVLMALNGIKSGIQ